MNEKHPEVNDKIYSVGTIVRVFSGYVLVKVEDGRLITIPIYQLVWVSEEAAWFYGTN